MTNLFRIYYANIRNTRLTLLSKYEPMVITMWLLLLRVMFLVFLFYDYCYSGYEYDCVLYH